MLEAGSISPSTQSGSPLLFPSVQIQLLWVWDYRPPDSSCSATHRRDYLQSSK